MNLFYNEHELKQIVTESLNPYMISDLSKTIVKYVKSNKITCKNCNNTDHIFSCPNNHIHCYDCEPDQLNFQPYADWGHESYGNSTCKQCYKITTGVNTGIKELTYCRKCKAIHYVEKFNKTKKIEV